MYLHGRGRTNSAGHGDARPLGSGDDPRDQGCPDGQGIKTGPGFRRRRSRSRNPITSLVARARTLHALHAAACGSSQVSSVKPSNFAPIRKIFFCVWKQHDPSFFRGFCKSTCVEFFLSSSGRLEIRNYHPCAWETGIATESKTRFSPGVSRSSGFTKWPDVAARPPASAKTNSNAARVIVQRH